MRNRKIVTVLMFLCLMPAALGLAGTASANKAAENSGTIAFTDMAGRKIELDGPIDRIIAIGSALRIYTYVAGTDKLVGVERKQQRVATGRPYIMANPSLENLPVIGEGHPDDPDPELIMQANPDVIVAGDIMDRKSLELMQKRTGVPVIITSQGNAVAFDETLYQAIGIIGKITGKQDRANDVVWYMETCKTELAGLTKPIPEHEKPSIFIGGLSYKGIHGIESTACRSPLLMAIGAKNVVDELKTTGSVMIDKEKLIEWDPEIIVIDAGGLGVVKQDYIKNPNFYKALSAVKNGRVYCQLPDVAYYRNIETAIADIYFLGKLMYPEAFKNINPRLKADEIYSFMLGKPLYDKMAELYGGFAAIALGE
jgi:iron complex transport system substrate-binding protein